MRYEWVKDQMKEAALRCGRSLDEIALVAVSKNFSREQIEELYVAGQRHFGEARLQQVLIKQQEMPQDCQWHLIGSLQANKVRKAVGRFALIHSVDSIALAQKIAACSHEEGVVTPVLLQANCSGESSKHGLTPDQWKREAETLFSLPNLCIKGLMTMASGNGSESECRDCFAQLRRLRDELQLLLGPSVQLQELSMGMSRDFQWAIAEGATIIRLGSVLIGG